jgi:hypothetical protein
MAVKRSGGGPVELTVQQQGLQELARALKAEADGKALRKDLMKQLKAAVEPIREKARSNLMSIGSAGLTEGASLRTAVASQLKAETRLSGRSAGVRLRVRRKGMPRGFVNAPKALNTPKGWRHQVYGRDVFVQQIAVPAEWFDRAAREGRKPAQKAAMEAVEAMAQRVADRAK